MRQFNSLCFTGRTTVLSRTARSIGVHHVLPTRYSSMSAIHRGLRDSEKARPQGFKPEDLRVVDDKSSRAARSRSSAPPNRRDPNWEPPSFKMTKGKKDITDEGPEGKSRAKRFLDPGESFGKKSLVYQLKHGAEHQGLRDKVESAGSRGGRQDNPRRGRNSESPDFQDDFESSSFSMGSGRHGDRPARGRGGDTGRGGRGGSYAQQRASGPKDGSFENNFSADFSRDGKRPDRGRGGFEGFGDRSSRGGRGGAGGFNDRPSRGREDEGFGDRSPRGGREGADRFNDRPSRGRGDEVFGGRGDSEFNPLRGKRDEGFGDRSPRGGREDADRSNDRPSRGRGDEVFGGRGDSEFNPLRGKRDEGFDDRSSRGRGDSEFNDRPSRGRGDEVFGGRGESEFNPLRGKRDEGLGGRSPKGRDSEFNDRPSRGRGDEGFGDRSPRSRGDSEFNERPSRGRGDSGGFGERSSRWGDAARSGDRTVPSRNTPSSGGRGGSNGFGGRNDFKSETPYETEDAGGSLFNEPDLPVSQYDSAPTGRQARFGGRGSQPEGRSAIEYDSAPTGSQARFNGGDSQTEGRSGYGPVSVGKQMRLAGLRPGNPDSFDATPGRRISKHDMPVRVHHTTAASQFLYGRSVVQAALAESRRKIYRLYVYKGEDRKNQVQDASLERLAGTKGVKVIHFTDSEGLRVMDKMSDGRPHNGCVLEASPLPQLPLKGLGPLSEDAAKPGFGLELGHQSIEEAEYNGTSDFFAYEPRSEQKPFVLLLDSILDPGNLGAILRTAAFLGVTAVVITRHESATLTSVALKASAGAAEFVPIFTAESSAEFLSTSKDAGWTAYAAVAGGPRSRGNSHVTLDRIELYDPLSSQPTILVMGSEGTGLHRNVVRLADFEVSIPNYTGILSTVDSLNVSVATGILCAEFLKKQRKFEIDDTSEAVAKKKGDDDRLWG